MSLTACSFPLRSVYIATTMIIMRMVWTESIHTMVSQCQSTVGWSQLAPTGYGKNARKLMTTRIKVIVPVQIRLVLL